MERKQETVSLPDTTTKQAYPPTEQVQGIVERVTFHSEESGYTVARLKVPSARDLITIVGNTGTYLDAPYHRYRDGADLAGIPLARTAHLPALTVRVTGAQQPGIDVGALAAFDVTGMAVLLHTGDDARFGSPAYAENQHFLTRGGRSLARRE